jgi:iron complex outermembrane receptor protein
LRLRIASAAVCALLGGGLIATSARADAAADDQAVEQLRALSIEELANVQVTTVSRREESLARAPAATYVITRDEIMRSGAKTLPEMLRLAPNLFVAQTSANGYVVTARGFSGNNGAQNFSNKLLILIDGRSVYSPLFSGIGWDMQDVLPDDIDHIEVISGPAGTLWGANAVEGVINIITRNSADTGGAFVDVGGGDLQQNLGLRYGGRLGEQATWRVSAHAYRAEDLVTTTGASADDRWSRVQAGFRLDWAPSERDAVIFEGSAYKGSGETFDSLGGGHLLARWNHQAQNGSALQVQAYVDRAQRGHDTTGGVPQWVNTYDLDVQDAFALGARQEVVVGGGLRLADYSIPGTSSLFFTPSKRTLNLPSVFAQDTIALTPRLGLILGLKLESDPFSHWSALPNARLTWKASDSTFAWAAVSRAIRAPTPFDVDVRERPDPNADPILVGNPGFQPETLTAYEAGLRVQPSPRVSFSVSAYYDDYDDLRTVDLTHGALPITWGNGMEGHTYGLEAWGKFQATPWWRLSAGLNLLREKLRFNGDPDAFTPVGVSQQGDDPRTQAQIQSYMDLGHGITWQAMARHVSALPDPHVPAYSELNTRVAWNITSRLQIALAGYNLLHERHQEFPGLEAVPRSVFAELRWGF